MAAADDTSVHLHAQSQNGNLRYFVISRGDPQDVPRYPNAYPKTTTKPTPESWENEPKTDRKCSESIVQQNNGSSPSTSSINVSAIGRLSFKLILARWRNILETNVNFYDIVPNDFVR